MSTSRCAFRAVDFKCVGVAFDPAAFVKGDGQALSAAACSCAIRTACPLAMASTVIPIATDQKYGAAWFVSVPRDLFATLALAVCAPPSPKNKNSDPDASREGALSRPGGITVVLPCSIGVPSGVSLALPTRDGQE